MPWECSNRHDQTHPGSDAGVSLVEQLVAIVIISTAVVALVTGLGAISGASEQNRETTNVGLVANNYAEALVLSVTAANWCSASYTPSYTEPAGYEVSADVSACPATTAGTPQMQPILVTATGPNGTTEQLTVVVRKP
jgi:type II secretory pathway pseudopilin PulG